MYEMIKDYTNEIEEELINIRRDFHKHPEKGWEEVRTSSIIADILEQLGYNVLVGEDVTHRESRMGVPEKEILDAAYERAIKHGGIEKYAEKMKDGMTGVIGIIEFEEPGPTVAMRFDIDALPLFESTKDTHVPVLNKFCSTFDGNMHACGHDGHTSIGLGVAKQLIKLKDKMKGKAILIFQPAEEGVRGAKSIVDKGHLEGVDYFLASHITKLPEGEDYDLYPGSGGALATSKLDVEFFGKSTHASGSPEEGNNAVMALATSILNLHSIPRHSKGATRINVGVVSGGTGRNIIPDYANLQIETRGLTTEINDYVKEYALRIIENSAKMNNCTFNISLAGEAYSLESDKELLEYVGKIAQDMDYKLPENLRMDLAGSEDVSYMMKAVQDQGGQATFIRLMTKVESSGHNVEFDFDESVISKGVNVFTSAVYSLMK